MSERVLAVVKDLFFAARIRETARLVGVPIDFSRSVEELEARLSTSAPQLVILDLTQPEWNYDAVFAALEQHDPRPSIVAFTTHALARATQPYHGRCGRVVTKETFTQQLPDILKPLMAGGRSMTAQEFVSEVEEKNQELLRRLEPEATLRPEVEGDLTVVNLLKVALKNEIEASEIAARWMVTTEKVDVKLAFARQVGDEAKHYRLIADRLKELGFDAATFNPLAKGYGPLFEYLRSLTTTVERAAAGQFTREAIAVVKNRQFIEFCEETGDRVTAGLYRDIIEPDERYHHELGRSILLRYATTAEGQEAARRAAARTLELAEELQAMALKTGGIHHAPGC